MKGFGSALCSMTKRLIAACRSTTDRKMRFNRRFVSLAASDAEAVASGYCSAKNGPSSDAIQSKVGI